MNLGQKIFVKGFQNKVVSVNEFRNSFPDGAVTANAILYAIKNDLVDYVQVDSQIRLIVLTEKTLAYKPNKNSKRLAS